MKNRIIAALLLSSAVISAPAFADSARYSNDDPQSAPKATANVQGKTRAKVYQELVTAQNSGELARMNQTYRGH